MAPKEAALKAMEEVAGPVVAIALVLAAVFLPTVFIPGITGRLYTQFAVTIAISVLLSAFNALTLSPALCSILLRPKKETSGPLGWFYGWFNRIFGRATEGYVSVSGGVIRKAVIGFVILAVMTAGIGLLGKQIPGGFLPEEDQGYIFSRHSTARCRLASTHLGGSAAGRADHHEHPRRGILHHSYRLQSPKLCAKHLQRLFLHQTQGLVRKAASGEKAPAIIARLNRELEPTAAGNCIRLFPAGHPGSRHCGRRNLYSRRPCGQRHRVPGGQHPKVHCGGTEAAGACAGIHNPSASVPQYFVDVDRDKVLSQGVDLGQVYGTLQAFMGGQFVNYFNRFGRQWQVYVEAEGDYRTDVKHLGQFYVRNSKGDPVPLAAVTRTERRSGPEFTMRYNLFRSAQINATAAPGYSTSQAMKALEEVFGKTMPSDMGFDYMGMSFQEQLAQQGIPPAAIFALSLLFVFLILAALYESWSLPFSVLLSTPIAVFGAFAALLVRGMVFNIYAQIGLIVLIGLAAKNAILIVNLQKTEQKRAKI